MILDGILALALLAAIIVAFHFRAQAKATSSTVALINSNVAHDLQSLRATIRELSEGGSLSTILSRLNAVGTLVKTLVDDVRKQPDPVAPAAPDVSVVTPATEAPPTTAAEAAPGADLPAPAPAPSAGSGGTVEGTLAAIEQQIAALQARKQKVEDARKALQEALSQEGVTQ